MAEEKPWLFPSMGFRAFLNQYPFVFFFSFLCAFDWIFGSATASCFISAQTHLKVVQGYSPWTYTFLLGIALFALLHLLTESPRFQKLKYRQAVYALGIGALYCFYLFMKNQDITWIVFAHWFGAAALAAFLWPLVGWRLSPEEAHSYFWNFVEAFLKSVLVYFVLTAILSSIFGDGFLVAYLRYSLHIDLPYPVNNYYGIASSDTATFLVFPWYLLGNLGSFLNSPEKKKEESSVLGPRTAVGIASVVLVFYLFNGYVIFGPWWKHVTRYFVDGNYLLPLAGLFSIGVVRLQKGPWFIKWRGLYTKVISGLSILFLAFKGVIHNLYWGGIWEDLHFYSIFILLWFAGVFIYFLLRARAGWVWPAFALWVMMVLTLVGPFNPMSLSSWEHQNILKKEMSDAGILKDGQLVKPSPPLNQSTFGPIEGNLYWFSQNQGLNWLRKFFPPELGDLDWGKEKTRANLPKLLDWLGQAKPQPPYPNTKTFSIQNPGLRYGLKRLGDYELQDFYICQGQVKNNPQNYPGYFLGFPNLAQFLLIEFDGISLGEIPLDSLAKKIQREDAQGIPKDKMQPNAMTLEFENKKVEVKLYFSSVGTYLDGKQLKILSGSGVLVAIRK